MPEMETGRALFIMVLVIVTIAIAVALNGGGIPAGPAGANATLTGNVSIGPLCPVEPCTIPRDQLLAVYTARPISIAVPGGPIIASVVADPDTGYTVSLKPGTYTVVDIRHQGIGGSRDLPRVVTLRSGETVWLNISIDTGIR
jgi:hypothetical protein